MIKGQKVGCESLAMTLRLELYRKRAFFMDEGRGVDLECPDFILKIDTQTVNGVAPHASIKNRGNYYYIFHWNSMYCWYYYYRISNNSKKY